MLEPQKRGNIIVITGPSGVGKGTIVKQILSDIDNIVLSVSATTRPIRLGETNGVEYIFKTVDEFKALIEADQMLEWAVFADNYYGTYKAAIEKELNKGNDVILEIETQGAMQIKQKLPEAILLFISPPSLKDLKKRLIGRATESHEAMTKRLEIAKEELKLKNEFHYNIVNDNLDLAVKQVKDIILSLRKERP